MHIVRDFKQRLPPGVSLDDLVGAGNLGLVATRCTRGINLDASFRRPRSRVISRW
jgi:DNA-directed RNA polymerase specialized sigma subunit